MRITTKESLYNFLDAFEDAIESGLTSYFLEDLLRDYLCEFNRLSNIEKDDVIDYFEEIYAVEHLETLVILTLLEPIKNNRYLIRLIRIRDKRIDEIENVLGMDENYMISEQHVTILSSIFSDAFIDGFDMIDGLISFINSSNYDFDIRLDNFDIVSNAFLGDQFRTIEYLMNTITKARGDFNNIKRTEYDSILVRDYFNYLKRDNDIKSLINQQDILWSVTEEFIDQRCAEAETMAYHIMENVINPALHEISFYDYEYDESVKYIYDLARYVRDRLSQTEARDLSHFGYDLTKALDDSPGYTKSLFDAIAEVISPADSQENLDVAFQCIVIMIKFMINEAAWSAIDFDDNFDDHDLFSFLDYLLQYENVIGTLKSDN